VLVVTPSPNFGESVRAALEQTESYRVLVVSNKVPAIVRAEEESCRLAILDLDLGEQWVEDIGQSLRTVVPDMKLFVLAGDDELPPLLDSIRPWTLLRKPFQLATALVALARPGGAEDAAPPLPQTKPHGELPWLTDVDTAAQHLTRLTLESSSQAALITRENEVWAYAGELSQPAAQEIAGVMSRNWNSESDGDLLRFARLEATRAEHILYATRLAPGMLLGLVFDAETPFGTIRSQAGKLSSLLERDDAPPEIEVVTTSKLTWTPVSVPAVPEAAPEPETATSTEPSTPAAPEPQTTAAPEIAAVPASVPDADEPEMHEDVDEEDIPIPEIQSILRDVPSPEPERKPEPAPPVDPDATRRTVLPRAVGAAPLPSLASAASRPIELAETAAAQPTARPTALPTAAPRATDAKPSEVDHTLPHSLIGFAGQGASGQRITLEPVQAGVYHLTYACLLLPRFPEHYLTGEVADKLSEWMPIICVAFGWRLEYLAVRPEYLQWVSNVPPATSPGYVMRIMRTQTSEKILTAFPGLKKDNPSGDFWAPGYLIMGGTQPHPSQLVKDYIKQARQRQGSEKPKR
jgi:REP element-mobilizing transposase RayT/ActR/RegA family two-component response regulator